MTVQELEKNRLTFQNRNPIEFISQAIPFSNGVQIAPDTALAPPNFPACISTPRALNSVIAALEAPKKVQKV